MGGFISFTNDITRILYLHKSYIRSSSHNFLDKSKNSVGYFIIFPLFIQYKSYTIQKMFRICKARLTEERRQWRCVRQINIFQVFNGAITTILKLLIYQTLLLFFFIGILYTFHKDLQRIRCIKLTSGHYRKKGISLILFLTSYNMFLLSSI